MDEIDCRQDGQPIFNAYKKHIPSSEDKCFNVNGVDFYSTKDGTRNIRLSNAGCSDIDTTSDFESDL